MPASRVASRVLLALLTLGSALGIVLGIGLAVAPSASAHATLTSTSPAPDSVVPRHLARVSVSFDESVGVSTDSLRVYGPHGSRADTGGARHNGADSVTVDLRPGLPDGTYTVAWQVVSADSHPVSGAFTFSIGHPSSHLSTGSLTSHPNRLIVVWYDASRALAFVGYAALAGGVAFLLVCWPSGRGDPGVRRLLTAAWTVGVATASLAFLLQGPYASFGGLGDITDGSILGTTLRSRLGILLVVRVALLVVAAVLGTRLLSPARTRAVAGRDIGGMVGWLVLTAGLAATWSLSGHASLGRQRSLAVASDMTHLVAVAVWVGGLVILAAATLRSRLVSDAWEAVRRFSTIAGWCVLVIIATGSYQAWRNVGHWAALVETTYGRLILAKISGLIVLISLGYLARRRIGHRLLERPGPMPADDQAGRILRRLRVSVGYEVLIAVAVLAVTSVLVSTATGREAYTPPFSAAERFDTGTVDGIVRITVTPATLGPQTVHLVLTDTHHQPYQPVELDAALTLPSAGIGPLVLTVHRVGPGSYSTAPAPVGIAGTWTVSVTIRSDAFDETTVQVPVDILQSRA